METRSPKFDFMEVGREGWGAANVVIDISDHEDGQKVAFQRHWSVGRPHFIGETGTVYFSSSRVSLPMAHSQV